MKTKWSRILVDIEITMIKPREQRCQRGKNELILPMWWWFSAEGSGTSDVLSGIVPPPVTNMSTN